MARLLKGTEAVVTNPGTAVPLATGEQFALSLIIRAKTTNTGKVWVGDVNVASTDNDGLAAGDAIPWQVGAAAYATVTAEDLKGIDMSNVYVDAAVGGEGVDIWHMEVSP